MNRFNGMYVALFLFGIVNLLYEVADFGGEMVDLPSTQFFWYSIWILVRNTVGFTLLLSAPIWFFGKNSRIVLALTFCYVLGIGAAMRYSENVFHANLSVVWFNILENTSFHEIGEFLRMSATCSFIAAVAFLVLTMSVGIVLVWNAWYPKPSKRSCLIGIVFLVPFFLANCLLIRFQNGNWKYGINQMPYTQFVFGTIKSIAEMRGINQACENSNLPERLRVSVDAAVMPDGVFVLGESSTRNNWHLYGYPRQTTPRMDALCECGEAMKFEDIVGTQPATAEALALLLTDVSFDDKASGNWTLPMVYRRAGYRCVLISNQLSWGSTTTTLYKIFNGCEKRTYLRTEFGENVYDEKLVAFLEKELQSSDGRPTIVFLHLAGIHYPVNPEHVHPVEDAYFNDSIDEDFMKSFPSHIRNRLNRYDNGILYEDKVLGMIVDILRSRSRPSFMFFISDHGESPRSETWRSYVDNDLYELPALLWVSKSYNSCFPEMAKCIANACRKSMQSDEITHGLLELGFIKGVPTYSSNLNFFSDEFTGRRPRFINKGRSVYLKDTLLPATTKNVSEQGR